MAGSAIFKIVRSRLTTITDRHVTASIHHLRARTGISNMLSTNMLVTNILGAGKCNKPRTVIGPGQPDRTVLRVTGCSNKRVSPAALIAGRPATRPADLPHPAGRGHGKALHAAG